MRLLELPTEEALLLDTSAHAGPGLPIPHAAAVVATTAAPSHDHNGVELRTSPLLESGLLDRKRGAADVSGRSEMAEQK